MNTMEMIQSTFFVWQPTYFSFPTICMFLSPLRVIEDGSNGKQVESIMISKIKKKIVELLLKKIN